MNIVRKLHWGLWIATAIVSSWFVWTINSDNKQVRKIWFTQDRLLALLKERLHTHAFSVKPSQNSTLVTRRQTQKKKILYGNSFWDYKDWNLGFGDKPFQRLKCDIQNCELTDNLTEIKSSDAILFHIHQLKGRPPPRYSANQRWIFWMLESPGWSANMWYKTWKGLFNWTMTYRLDSDIRLRYGQVKKIKHSPSTHATNWNKEKWTNKRKMVAWMVSNCGSLQSKREEYVQELKRYIDVDVYGRCGNLKCDRFPDQDVCLKMAEKDYKFYLSFENSLCKDYVTEKFFKILPFNLVPVVRGVTNYSVFAPSSWYIDADQFNSPKKLAEHLHKVGNDFTLYSKHLKGREEYKKFLYRLRDNPAWCELCRKLNDPSEPVKVYDNIDTWWSKDDCREPSWPAP